MSVMDRFLKSNYSKSFLIAIGVHAVLLFCGTWTLIKKAEFGVEQGRSSLEVNLIAAPAEETPVAEAPPQPEIQPTLKTPEPEDMVLRQEEKPIQNPSKPIEEKPKIVKKVEEKGDGSSQIGKDKTTLHSSGGATVEAKPDYLKNPSPRYPEAARKKGQHGVVLLLVSLSAQGEPKEIHIQKSSGYSLLDKAALEGVWQWKFKPASLGGISVGSQVTVPVVFNLN
jgi:protein TonB